MRVWLFLVLVALPAVAAEDKVPRGAEVYRSSCAVPYCHGPEGKPGRAPALAGRSFEAAVIVRTASMGIPNTSMPSFAALLKPDDIQAVAAYIVSLNRPAPATGSRSLQSLQAALPKVVERGRALFFDAARTGACGSCHEVGGRGALVSTGLQDLEAAHIGDLRGISTPAVLSARPSGEPAFPAIVAEKNADRVRVYDVSSRLPVLRSFTTGEVVLTPGSSWTHATAAALYSDAELDDISRYLRWAAGR